MTGCGTDNEIALAGTEVIGIEAMAAEESTELTAIGENVPAGNTESATAGDTEQTGTAKETDAASGIEGTQGQEAQLPWQEQTTADRMAGRTKVKGIYVTGPKAGSGGMEDLIRLVDETELNAMVIDVKNDEGNLTFRLTNEEIPQDIPVLDRISEMQAGIRYIRDIQTMMQELKDHNIYTIARIVCFKDPILAAAQPELALTKPDGKPVTDANGLAWVNPYRQEVWEYLTELAEMAADLGFDEIQYDYVRFPVGSDADAADYGVDMEAYPKRQAIQDFLSYAGDRLHEKGCVVTADVFGTIIGSETDRRAGLHGAGTDCGCHQPHGISVPLCQWRIRAEGTGCPPLRSSIGRHAGFCGRTAVDPGSGTGRGKTLAAGIYGHLGSWAYLL